MAGKSLSRAVRKAASGLKGKRYARASKSEKGAILNEFVALSGYNRNYATRILGNSMVRLGRGRWRPLGSDRLA